MNCVEEITFDIDNNKELESIWKAHKKYVSKLDSTHAKPEYTLIGKYFYYLLFV